MKEKLKELANNVLRPSGFELVRRGRHQIEMKSALRRLSTHGITPATVIDIGAAQGKWSTMAMDVLRASQFLAIEPLREREEQLKIVAKRYPLFDYSLCIAGDIDGTTARLNVASDLDGSTVDGHGGEARDVTVRSIDSLVKEKNLSGPFLIKFDTHGYELPILRGAERTLDDTQVIIMEVYNFQFVAQALRFHQMCAHMEQLGFRCYDMADPILRKRDNSLWQMDLFFARDESKIFGNNQYV